MKGVELYGRVRYAVRIEGLSERAAARRFGLDPRTAMGSGFGPYQPSISRIQVSRSDAIPTDSEGGDDDSRSDLAYEADQIADQIAPGHRRTERGRGRMVVDSIIVNGRRVTVQQRRKNFAISV